MRKLSSFMFAVLALLLFSGLANAQLSGTKTIPGDYATISAAILNLNAVGVGGGGVTFNVAAGHTETTTDSLAITATGTVDNPIVFQKSGAGANPIITRTDAGSKSTSTMGGFGDAVIKLYYTDYITFDGIDVSASQSGIEYGYMTLKTATDGCKNVTIKNSVIAMTKGTSAYVMGIYISNGSTSVSSATGVSVTANSGRNSNILITGNTVQNVHAGIYFRGSSAAGFSDSIITVGQTGAGNIIQNFGGASATTTYGVYFIYVKDPTVAYNTINNAGGGGSAHGATLYGVFYSTVTGDVAGSNNALTLANSSTSATHWIYNGNACTSESYNNNTFAGTLASTSSSYIIYSSNATNNKTISGNSTSGTINKTGASGAFYVYYNYGSPTGGTETLTNNNFSNITVTGTSSLYGIYSSTSASQNRVTSGNTISGWNVGSGSVYALYVLTTTSNQVYNNTVNNITAGSGIFYGIYFSGTNPTVYGNTVYNITSAGATVAGIYNSGSGTTNLYKNNIYGITSTNTIASLSGILISTGTANYVYNNYISDLKATASGIDNSIKGIFITSTATSSAIGLYYNTIYLNASSTGTNFGTTGIYHTANATATTAALDMRNNIIVNNSTPNGTGFTVAYRRSSSAFGNYASTSNNNDFYAGTPGASNLIYFDVTNSDQTIGAYKTRVAPRDGASFTELPPFVNVTTAPYDLHIQTTIPTQLEKGGSPVSTPIAVTDDYDGNIRNVTLPDVGADEGDFTPLDLTPPVITYTPLGNTSLLTRTLTTSITDGTGVPTSGSGLPVLYWSINSASGPFTAATASYISGNQYDFTFTTTGAVANDVIYYYIVARDIVSPAANIGSQPSAGAGGFTYDPPAAGTPPTTPSSYLVVGAPLSGDYTVGTAMFNKITGRNIYYEKVVTKVMREIPVYEEGTRENGGETRITGTKKTEVEEISWIPMENGKKYEGNLFAKKSENPNLNFISGTEGIYATITAAVADLNLRGVSGPVRFLLSDAAYPSETFPLTINITSPDLPTATNTVTFKPNTGVVASISGAPTASAIFKLNGADYIVIDGSNTVGGSTKDLTIENTATAGGVIWLASKGTGAGCTYNTVKNTNIVGYSNASGNYAIFSGGTSFGSTGDDNDYNTYQNNTIGKAYYGIYALSSAAGTSNNNTITQNIIGNATDASSVGNIGIYLTQVTNSSISQNEIFNLKVSTTPKGISLTSGCSGLTVDRNKIYTIKYAGTSGYGGWGIEVNPAVVSSNIIVSNNMIYDIGGDGWSAIIGSSMCGIVVQGTSGGVKLYYNSINLYGNYSKSSATITAGVYVASTVTTVDMRNNVISNSMVNTTTLTSKAYSIYSAAANTAYDNINYNDYFASGSQAVFGYLGTDVADLAAWKTATGKDANSVSGDPKFVSNTDLHIQTDKVSPVSEAGTPIAGITTDFDGNTRSLTTPDIGADEYEYVPPSVLDPASFAAAKVHSTQIDLSWTPTGDPANPVMLVYNTTDVFGIPDGGRTYSIGEEISGGGFVIYAGTDVTYSHSGLTRNTAYYYKAFSYTDPAYEYSPGATANASTSLPAVPVTFTATPFSTSQIDLAWTKNAASNDVIIATNSTSTFGDPVNGTTYNSGDPVTGGGTIIYRGNLTAFNHTSLTASTTYYYKAWSVDGGVGYSTTGKTANATTLCEIAPAPFTQDFELAAFPPVCWTIGSAASYNVQRSTAASGYGTGTASALFPFYSISSGSREITTFDFNTSSLTSPLLKFDHAYATYSGENDQLRIDYSTNGGTDWTQLVIYDGGLTGPLNTGGSTSSSFVPTAAQWATKSVTLPSGVNKLKFVGISGYGNQLYVDNIKVVEAPAIPVFSISPDTASFNSTTIGGGSADQVFTITNTGGGTLTINSSDFTLTGTDPGSFQIIGATTLNLAAGEYGTVRVQFTPNTSIGNKSANLHIVDNITDAVHDIPLLGTSIVNPPQFLTSDIAVGTNNPLLSWKAPTPASEVKVDDGSVDGFYWVASPSTANQYFANQLYAPYAGYVSQIGLAVRANIYNEFASVKICPDDGTGKPNLAAPLASFSNVNVGTTASWVFLNLSTPIPVTAGQTFYIAAQWPEGNTTGPFIATDLTASNARSFFTSDGGSTWTGFSGNFFMRAYMNAPGDMLISGEASPELKMIPNGSVTEIKDKIKLTENTKTDVKTKTNNTDLAGKVTGIQAPLIYTQSGNKVLSNYTVKRGDASGSYNQTFSGVSNLNYTDNTVTAGNTYYYVVEAVYIEGTSGYSNEVSVLATNPNFGTFGAGSGSTYKFSNNTPGGNPGANEKPNYGWIPTTDFTPITFTNNDDGYTQVNFGGSSKFKFFGTDYTSVFVGVNGYLTFGAGSTDYTPAGALPQAGDPANMIAAAFYDLYNRTTYTPASNISYKIFSDKIVISYQNIYMRSAVDGQNYLSFQVQLYLSDAPTVNSLSVINYNDDLTYLHLINTLVMNASVGLNGPGGLLGYNYRYAGVRGPMFNNNPELNPTGLSAMALGYADLNAPLPVTLASFTSNLNGRDVKLNWRTSSETNNAGFEIERAAADSDSPVYSKIGYVNGHGTTSNENNYSFEDKKLNSGKYSYRLKQVDLNGNYEYHNLTNTVEVGLPTKFELSQNYPNPFNPSTKIDFSLPLDSRVNIILYDITGREVKTLVNDSRKAGYYTVQMDGSMLSSGTYFYRIITKSAGQDFVMTKKMMLVK